MIMRLSEVILHLPKRWFCVFQKIILCRLTLDLISDRELSANFLLESLADRKYSILILKFFIIQYIFFECILYYLTAGCL